MGRPTVWRAGTDSFRTPVPRAAQGLVRQPGFPSPVSSECAWHSSPAEGELRCPYVQRFSARELAISLVVATVIFGSSLSTLVSRPSLYGWNWSYMLSQVGSGGGNVPPQAFALLARDPDVASYTGVSYMDGEIDGQGVPFLIGGTHPAVSPPILSGHTVDGKNQIVLGGATMAALHTHLGGTITFCTARQRTPPSMSRPRGSIIVGTATMPAVGFASVVSDHTSMGTGALLSNGVLPAGFPGVPWPVRTPPSTGRTWPSYGCVPVSPRPTGRANLQRIADAANEAFAESPTAAAAVTPSPVVAVQRPAEIVNYRSIGRHAHFARLGPGAGRRVCARPDAGGVGTPKASAISRF